LFVFALIFCFPVYVFFSAFLFWHPSLSFTFVCFCLYLFSDIIVIVVFVDVLLLLYHCFVVCFLLLLSDIFLVRFFTFPRCDDHLLSPVVIMRVIIFVSTFERPVLAYRIIGYSGNVLATVVSALPLHASLAPTIENEIRGELSLFGTAPMCKIHVHT
jgi:hypothetical protein